MILYHVTSEGCLAAILREGVRPDLAQTVRQEVWLVEANRLWWGFAHMMRRHTAPLDTLVAIRVAVSGSRLKKRGNGLWTSATLISPRAIQAVTSPQLKTRRIAGRKV